MYKIVGGDQREYGPATSDQIREWIASGRANGQTLASFEGSPWKPLSTFPEFADALRTATPPPLAGGTPPSAFPGQAMGQPMPGGVYSAQKGNNIAIAGLVLSILGICCVPFALIGLILSVVGFVQINNEPQKYSTSKIVPILGILFGLLWIGLNIVLFATGAFDEVMRNMQR